MDAILEPMSAALGQPMDQTKYVFCLLLGFPLSFVYRALPKNRTLRNLFSIVTGLSFCIFCLGTWSWVHSFFTAAVSYLLVRFGPVGISHKIVFLFCMAYMSFSHIYRMYTDYLGWSLDYTGPQMVLTLKLTSFAWSYYDGTRPKEELPKELLERRITKLPGLIEYFGWVYFFPAFLAGPAIELHHYTSFMDGSLFGEKKTAGSTFLPGLKVLGMALCCAPLTVLSGFFPPTYFLTEAFRAEPLWLKAARAYFHAAPLRGKYYVAWFLAEAGCVGTGIAYNPKAPGAHDTLRNCHPLNVEFGTNFREIINSWNIATSNWLRHYVYMRTTKNGKPTAYSTFITYTVSAFWHGFYPGYYLFFVGGAIGTEVAKPARRIFRKYFVTADDKPIYPRKFLYDIFTTVVSQWFLCYLALAFALLSVDNALTAWGSLYYAPIIASVALLLILPVFDRPVKKEAVQKKVQ